MMATTTTTAVELGELSREGNVVPDPDKRLSVPLAAQENSSESPVPEQQELSRRRSAAIIITVAGVNFLNVCGSGILTVALPQMGRDLNLPRELLLW